MSMHIISLAELWTYTLHTRAYFNLRTAGIVLSFVESRSTKDHIDLEG